MNTNQHAPQLLVLNNSAHSHAKIQDELQNIPMKVRHQLPGASGLYASLVSGIESGTFDWERPHVPR